MRTFNKILRNYKWQGLWIYWQLKTGKTKAIQVPGLKNSITLRKKTSDIPLFKQIFVKEEYKFKAEGPIRYIVDAGANIGLSTLYFLKQYPAAEVVSIEVARQNFELLTFNTRNYPTVKGVNAGLWSKSATVELFDPGRGHTGYMLRPTDENNPNGFRTIQVADILKEYDFPYIDLFKIDIEGAERELLSENTEWLARTRIMIIELHDYKKAGCSNAFFKLFSQYNFDCVPFGQNFLLINRDFKAS